MNTELKPNEYKCCFCGGVFEKGWTDEQAADERLENFGAPVADDDELACDDCYKQFIQQSQELI